MPKVTVKSGQPIRIGDVTLCVSEIPGRARFMVDIMEIPTTTPIQIGRDEGFRPLSKKFTGIAEMALDTDGSPH